MNIIHFSKSDDRGAYITAYRFHSLLKEAGHTSAMLVEIKTKSDDDIIQFRLTFLEKALSYFHKLKRRIKSLQTTDYLIDESIKLPTKYFIKNLPFTPDVIAIHWVSGFINFQNIYELSTVTKAPVIWRFNDMNALTGGCHYNKGCLHYTNGCGNCPILKNPSTNDLSFRNYQNKIKWFSKLDITLVSTTTQIDEELKSSLIAKYCKTEMIILSSYSKFFLLADKNLAAESLQLPPNRKIIFFGAQNINDPRKGFKELLAALNILKKNISTETGSKILLVYASLTEIDELTLPFKSIKLPFLKSEALLAKAYQAATVYVSPSIEDAGPMMILESMLCGTPTVAFSIGLAKDRSEERRVGKEC